MCRAALVLAAAIVAFAFATVPAAAKSYPPGIRANDIVSGIAPGDDAGSCCWIVGSATFHADVPTDADTMIVEIFNPVYSLPGRSRGYTVTINRTTARRCCYGPGLASLAFSIPFALHGRRVTVTIVPSATFVPEKAGKDRDTRQLGGLLRSVRFVNVAAGTQGAPPIQALPAYRVAAGIALALGLIVSFALVRRRPVFAVLALAATDPFALYLFAHGTSITLPKTVLVGCVLGLGLAWRSHRARPGRAFALVGGATALLVASMVISSIHAGSHAAALRETLKAIEYLVTFAVAYVAFRADPDERLFRCTIVLLTIVVALLALAQLVVGTQEFGVIAGRVVPRIAGSLEGPNQLAGFLGIVLPLLLAWALSAPRRPLAWTAFALGAIALAFTFSRGGQGALLVALALICALRFAPQRATAIVTSVSALFGALLAVAFAQFAGVLRWTFLFGNNGDVTGLGTRSELWSGAYRLWRSSPLIGIGPGNFELEISHFDPGVRTHANSIFFNTLAEQGIAGGVALAWLFVATIAAFARRFRDPLILGTLGVICAMWFHQIVDTIWIYPKVGILLWTVLGVAAARADHE